MNYGGEAADQIVRYSLDGIDHGLRLSGTMAKNLAIFIAAVLKDQKKSYGKTRMIRMLKDNRPLKFFTVPTDRLSEFCKEGKKRGLLYVVIKDKKNPAHSEVMVFADDAAKVNRVMDKMNLDFVKSESGAAVHEVTEGLGEQMPVKEESVQMPEGEVRFEISDFEEDFNIGGSEEELGNFTKARERPEENPSVSSSRSNDISIRQEEEPKKPSVRKELEQIKQEKEAGKKKEQRNKNRSARRRKNRKKNRGR